MSLLSQLDQDFIQALKSKDSNTLSVLRLLKSALKNKEIELHSSLDEAQVVQIIKSEIKKRTESIEAFEGAGRNELADKEKQEMQVLKKYLPAQLTKEQVVEKVKTIIDSLSAEEKQNFGNVMKACMSTMQGMADGQIVSQAVKELLS